MLEAFGALENYKIKLDFETRFDVLIGIMEPIGGVYVDAGDLCYQIPDTVSGEELLVLLKSSLDLGVNLLETAYGANVIEFESDAVY